MFDTHGDASLQTAFATINYVRQISASTASELENRVCYKTSSKKDGFVPSFFTGSPTETRTPDSALRGLRLNRLTMRPRRRTPFCPQTRVRICLTLRRAAPFPKKSLLRKFFSGALFLTLRLLVGETCFGYIILSQ